MIRVFVLVIGITSILQALSSAPITKVYYIFGGPPNSYIFAALVGFFMDLSYDVTLCELP